MKLLTRHLLLVTLVGLLAACDTNKGTEEALPAAETTMQPSAAPTPIATDTQVPLPAPGQVTIDLTPGHVSIRATEVDELALLEQLAAMANFELLTSGIQWSTVTVDIEAKNLHTALTKLLRAYPYQIVYTPDKDSQLEVLSEVFVSPELVPAKKDNTITATKTTAQDETDPEVAEDDQPDAETQAQLQALKSDSETTRAAAAEDIEPTGEGLIALTELLTSDPSPEVRIATTHALEFSDDPLAIQALVACLNDEYPAVLVECIKALEHIGDSANVAQLQPLLEHYDESVRTNAARAIENLQ